VVLILRIRGRPQGVQEHLGGLRARDPVPAVDDAERHAVRAESARLLGVGAHGLGVLGAREDDAHAVGRQADLAEQTSQRLRVRQVGALGEVRAQQPFLGRVGGAEVGGQVQRGARPGCSR
jgi:hypothetical protein